MQSACASIGVMSAIAGASELIEPTPGTRSFRTERVVRLGDVDPGGRLRLDATARLLQDVASDDATDAGLDGAWGWIVRRTLIEVRHAAMLDEAVAHHLLHGYGPELGRTHDAHPRSRRGRHLQHERVGASRN